MSNALTTGAPYTALTIVIEPRGIAHRPPAIATLSMDQHFVRLCKVHQLLPIMASSVGQRIFCRRTKFSYHQYIRVDNTQSGVSNTFYC